jgi:hypothetical protein
MSETINPDENEVPERAEPHTGLETSRDRILRKLQEAGHVLAPNHLAPDDEASTFAMHPYMHPTAPFAVIPERKGAFLRDMERYEATIDHPKKFLKRRMQLLVMEKLSRDEPVSLNDEMDFVKESLQTYADLKRDGDDWGRLFSTVMREFWTNGYLYDCRNGPPASPKPLA